MRSSDRSERLDLARGLPTTVGDGEALRRVKTLSPLEFEDYLCFLTQLPALSQEQLRAKRGPGTGRPFELR